MVVNKAIIVCTSNYKTIDEIKEHLGLPIYNRFDSIIKFADLPDMAKEKIAEREIERLKKRLWYRRQRAVRQNKEKVQLLNQMQEK